MSGPADAVLRTEGLCKRFGGLTATDAVSLTLQAGELHALIGPNGAGKTTLIGQLSGEILPDQGRVWLSGVDVTRASVDARARLGLARSYQITQFCPEFTALENVSLAAMQREGGHYDCWSPLRARRRIVDAAMHWVERLGLGPRAATPARDLGHGEHRQLELAMALALEPKVLLLDEPLAGMSSAESETMVGLLQGLRGRYPILLIEHDMNAVFALADRISVLVYGRIVATGRPEAIREDPEVRSAYLGDEGMDA